MICNSKRTIIKYVPTNMVDYLLDSRHPQRLVYIAANGEVYNSKEEAMEDMYKHEQSKTQG